MVCRGMCLLLTKTSSLKVSSTFRDGETSVQGGQRSLFVGECFNLRNLPVDLQPNRHHVVKCINWFNRLAVNWLSNFSTRTSSSSATCNGVPLYRQINVLRHRRGCGRFRASAGLRAVPEDNLRHGRLLCVCSDESERKQNYAEQAINEYGPRAGSVKKYA